MNRNLSLFAFILGLFAVVWVAVGYIGGHPLAFTVSCIIAVVYVAGALEMRRFHANTTALAKALGNIPDDIGHLGEWLQQVPAALQNAVRLRIEGERVALPGPGVTPYLVGLLVLLGMLGTFLGMVVTLNGAVLALESTTDLQTIRSALAAPVKGLGVAFGTSVAGVATSAMLGLISALCRRDRLQVGQLLDSKIASVLRDFSLTYQRQETFKALQVQAQALPELVGKLDAMMSQMAEQSRQLGEQLAAGQQRFHEEAKGLYTDLAQSVDQSLKTSLKDSATVAAQTIQPVVTATMASIAGETRGLHDKLFGTVETQLAGIAGQFAQTVGTVSDTWTQALSRHEKATDTQHQHLQSVLTAYADSFEHRSATLLASVESTQAKLQADAAQQHAALAETTAASQQQLAATLASQFDGVTSRLDQAVSQVADTFGERTQALLTAIDTSHAAFAQSTQAQQAAISEQVASQLDGIAQRFDGTVHTVSENWTSALAKHEQASDRLTQALEQTQTSLADTFAQRTAALLADMRATQADWQRDWATGEQTRQASFTDALTAMAGKLEAQWQQHGDATLAQQEKITGTLGDTARDLVATHQRQAETTIAEVTRLMQTAAEAPKAAAEVIGQLRHELSASMARDNSLLEERSRIMETLGALLDAINHASTEQRSAIDALVASSADLLERAGSQFATRVESEAGKLVEIGASITGGALDVASLGEAFGAAVKLFAESNDKMMAALQRIEGGLAKSLSRSDEQLAYYVAQAREIIDLSILSQKKMVDDLQRAAVSEA
jgi:DNA anti-recombination protein RmuC